MRINVDDPDVDMDASMRLTYRGKLFTGEAVELCSIGTIVALTTYIDGHEDGPSLEWYPDGKPQVEGLVRRYLPVGTWKKWHHNGRIAQEVRFGDKGESLRKRDWSEEGDLIYDSDEGGFPRSNDY